MCVTDYFKYGNWDPADSSSVKVYSLAALSAREFLNVGSVGIFSFFSFSVAMLATLLWLFEV
jgi:hypothetical protein